MLLRQAGIEPRTMAPDVDEDAVIAHVEAEEARRLDADEHVLLLARWKAADVTASPPAAQARVVELNPSTVTAPTPASTCRRVTTFPLLSIARPQRAVSVSTKCKGTSIKSAE
jgi:hypothetical protein